MDPKLDPDYRHFSKLIRHDTKLPRSRTVQYGSYDEDTASVVLAMTGLALTFAIVVGMLIAFRVL